MYYIRYAVYICAAPDLEDQRRLAIWHAAVEDGGSVEQTMLQATMNGLARSGKTSLLARLQGKRANPSEPSTGVMKREADILIKRSMTFFSEETEWVTVSELPDYASFVTDVLGQSLTQKTLCLRYCTCGAAYSVFMCFPFC